MTRTAIRDGARGKNASERAIREYHRLQGWSELADEPAIIDEIVSGGRVVDFIHANHEGKYVLTEVKGKASFDDLQDVVEKVENTTRGLLQNLNNGASITEVADHLLILESFNFHAYLRGWQVVDGYLHDAGGPVIAAGKQIRVVHLHEIGF